MSATKIKTGEPEMSAPNHLPDLPDGARLILKSVIMALANAGLITNANAEYLIASLGLADA